MAAKWGLFAIGTLTALSATVYYRSHTKPSPGEAVVRDTSVAPVDSVESPSIRLSGGMPVSDLRLAAMEGRLARLEQGDQARVALEPRSRADLPPPSPDRLAAATKNHEEWAGRFHQEAIDGQWAAPTERTISDTIAKVAGADMIGAPSVRCGTTMCAATLRFNSYATARTAVERVVQGNPNPKCARESFYPPPTDDSTPYETTVYYDCTAARAGD